MKIFLAILFLSFVAGPNGWSCSVSEDYRTPSSSDITCAAENILLVRLLGQIKPAEPMIPSLGRIRFVVIESLKGTINPKDNIDLEGFVSKSPGIIGNDSVPYQVTRRSSSGMCQPYDYHENGLFLLFLKSGSPYWAPFAALNEEVSGSDDPWVAWVKAEIKSTFGKPCNPFGGVSSIFNQGFSDLIDGRYDDAERKFKIVLDLDPNHSEAKKMIDRLSSLKSKPAQQGAQPDAGTGRKLTP